MMVCGSVWLCPVCSAKILAERAAETRDMIKSLRRQGRDVGMATFTMSHHAGQSLAQCWDAQSYAWSKVTSGRGWTADKIRYGALEWMRAAEVTVGANGWHCHIHCLIVFDGPTSYAMGRELAESMWQRWESALRRKGFDAVRDFASFDVDGAGGLNYRAADGAVEQLGDYFNKATADEAVYGMLKHARGENLTPFEVARAFVDTGDADLLDRWQEWARFAVGRKQLTYSQGFRALAGVGDELTDEQIAEADVGSEDVVFLPGESWREIRDSSLVVDLLEVAEVGGRAVLVQWLHEHGLAYVVPPPPRDG